MKLAGPRWPLLGCALLSLALLSGCTSTPPLGPVRAPELYPDRRSPERAFWTFLWAWREGDIPTLRRALAGWLLKDLELLLAAEGEQKVVEWYRRDASDLSLVDLNWKHRGAALAYLRAILSCGSQPRLELDISLLKRPDGWAVSGKRLVR